MPDDPVLEMETFTKRNASKKILEEIYETERC